MIIENQSRMRDRYPIYQSRTFVRLENYRIDIFVFGLTFYWLLSSNVILMIWSAMVWVLGGWQADEQPLPETIMKHIYVTRPQCVQTLLPAPRQNTLANHLTTCNTLLCGNNIMLGHLFIKACCLWEHLHSYSVGRPHSMTAELNPAERVSEIPYRFDWHHVSQILARSEKPTEIGPI